MESYQSIKGLSDKFSCDDNTGEKIVNRIPDIFALILQERMSC